MFKPAEPQIHDPIHDEKPCLLHGTMPNLKHLIHFSFLRNVIQYYQRLFISTYFRFSLCPLFQLFNIDPFFQSVLHILRKRNIIVIIEMLNYLKIDSKIFSFIIHSNPQQYLVLIRRD